MINIKDNALYLVKSQPPNADGMISFFFGRVGCERGKLPVAPAECALLAKIDGIAIFFLVGPAVWMCGTSVVAHVFDSVWVVVASTCFVVSLVSLVGAMDSSGEATGGRGTILLSTPLDWRLSAHKGTSFWGLLHVPRANADGLPSFCSTKVTALIGADCVIVTSSPNDSLQGTTFGSMETVWSNVGSKAFVFPVKVGCLASGLTTTCGTDFAEKSTNLVLARYLSELLPNTEGIDNLPLVFVGDPAALLLLHIQLFPCSPTPEIYGTFVIPQHPPRFWYRFW